MATNEGTAGRTTGGAGVLLILRCLLGGLFVFAASVKLSQPQEFVDSVMAFRILPDHLAQLATFVIPWAELICGVLLIVGLWTRPAALILSLLLVGFIYGIAMVLQRPEPVTCGCFGKFEIPCGKIVGPCHVVRNAVLLALSVIVVLCGAGAASFDRVLDRPRAGC